MSFWEGESILLGSQLVAVMKGVTRDDTVSALYSSIKGQNVTLSDVNMQFLGTRTLIAFIRRNFVD